MTERKRASSPRWTASNTSRCNSTPTLENGDELRWRMLGTVARPAFAMLLVLTDLGASYATECPFEFFGAATKLILVTTQGMSTTRGTLRSFERTEPGTAWKRTGAVERVAVGQRGLGWEPALRDKAVGGEPSKSEGDKRTPAGVFPLGSAFGFDRVQRPGYIQLKRGETFCVNDPNSRYYNQIVPQTVAGQRTSGEDMRAIGFYRRGLVIDYPTNASERGGSCIFLHVWRGAGSATAGCVALREAAVAHLQDWAHGTNAVIAILPEAALSRFSGCLQEAEWLR